MNNERIGRGSSTRSSGSTPSRVDPEPRQKEAAGRERKWALKSSCAAPPRAAGAPALSYTYQDRKTGSLRGAGLLN